MSYYCISGAIFLLERKQFKLLCFPFLGHFTISAFTTTSFPSTRPNVTLEALKEIFRDFIHQKHKGFET